MSKKMLHYMRAMLLLAAVLLVPQAIQAQTKTVTGTVTSASDKISMPGVSIAVKGTATGTITDVDGKYTLVVPENGVLVFSFIGFTTQEVSAAGKTIINVELLEEMGKLDEVVVTGYGGTQKRSKLTNSISSVKEELLTTGMHSNPAQALSGAVSGLKVTQSSGKPGSVPSIVLRGGTNYDGSGSPLVIIDGQVRSLNDINPADIESMDVLKDAGATAIYGARANNGVLLITTKRGKEGRSEISLQSRVGLNYLNEPYKFMNGKDYLHWVRSGVYNSGREYQTSTGTWTGHGAGVQSNLNGAQPYGTGNRYWNPANPTMPLDGNKSSLAIWSPMFLTDDLRFLLDKGWKTMIDPVTGNEIIYSEFDRSSTAFNHPAISQDYNISMSGGNEKGSYYAGLGYLDEQGLPVKTWYQRFNFTFNADYKIRTWLTSNSSFNFTDAKWKDVTNTSEGNYFSRMLSAPPTQREYNADGELLLGTNSGDGNPLYNIDKFIRNNNTNKIGINQGFKINLLKQLNLKLNGSWLIDEGLFESFNRDYLASPGVMNISRSSSAYYDRTLNQTYNAVVNYDVSLTNHSVNVLAGSEFFDGYNKGLSASGSGAATDDFMDLQYTSSLENKRGVDSWHERQRILSFFGRVNYDYMDKYLLSATFRQDGYSKLMGDNRWGFFPGVSAGWVITKEDFMRSYDHIFSFLKLRASYGLNGNASGIGAYQLQGRYSSSAYGLQPGFVVGNLPTPWLRWERSNTFETGLDMGFLSNSINVNATYYRRETLDKYASIPLPISSGFSGILSNNGELLNQGVEIDVSAKAVRTKDLTVDVNFNIAYNQNKVIQLPDNGLEKNRQGSFQVYDPKTGELIWVGGYQEGQRQGDIYAYKAIGIYKDDAHVAAIAANRKDISVGNNGSNNRTLYGPNLWATLTDAQKATGLPIMPGDVIWKDVNGDDVIDQYDMVKVGNVNPKWIGGFNTNASWKGLTLYARMDFALGFQQIDQIRPWFLGMMQGSFNTLEETKSTWTPENVNASLPRYTWADQLGSRNYARQSSLFVYDASYLSFREVSLSYKLPQNWLKEVGITGAEISATGQNLGYMTKSKLYTPEASSIGGIYGGYPLPRTVIFGVNLRF
jgi:TonB-linked SusC/RagA family outer membrane protein